MPTEALGMPLIFTTKLNNNLMKQLLSLITILVFSTSFAQELTLDKGKIYQNGVQLATFETKEVLKADLQALHLFLYFYESIMQYLLLSFLYMGYL